MPDLVVSAFGIEVANLDRSADFYTRIIGLRVLQTFDLADMDEVVVGLEKGPVIALMKHKGDARPAISGSSVKLVFTVADPMAHAARIRAEGLEVTREPAPFEGFGDTLVGLAKDPDGYVVELLGPG